MSILLAINGWNPAPWIARFQAAAPTLPCVDASEAFDPDAIHYAAVWKPEPGLLAKLPNLRAIFNLGAGVDALLQDTSLPPVPVCRIVNPDLTARMREWVVMNALMHLRQVPAYARQQANKLWRPLDQPSASDLRIGIMGMGELGRDCATFLAHIGFQVEGWARTKTEHTRFAGAADLPAFLAITDILVVLLPLTPETRGILNQSLFERLARNGALGGPILINGGRGGLQNEAELITAMQDGTLKAASLDVFESEPLPSTNPLWAMPNVIITPHVAADSTPDALVRVVLANIAGFEAGKGLQHVVDRNQGY